MPVTVVGCTLRSGQHTVYINVDFANVQTGSLFYGIANLVDDALGDGADVDAVGDDDVQIDVQLIAGVADADRFVGLIAVLVQEADQLALRGSHAGDTEASGSGIAYEIGKEIFGNFNDSKVIFQFYHIGSSLK